MWLFLLITLGTWFLPRYNQFYFVLKHTLTFLFLAILGIKITLKLFQKSLKNKDNELSDKKLLFMRSMTIVTIIIQLIVIASAQREYILSAETPPVEYCTYYDQYGNYIHGSRLMYNCPSPSIITNTEDKLEMVFDYTFFGTGDGYSGSSGTSIGSYSYRKVEDGAVKISVELGYNDEHLINYYRLREVVNYKADDYSRDESISNFEKQFTLENETFLTGYFEVIIDTHFEEGMITQTKQVFMTDYFEDIVADVYNLEFHDFLEEDVRWINIIEVPYTTNLEDEIEFDIYYRQPLKGVDPVFPDYTGTVKGDDGDIVLSYSSDEYDELYRIIESHEDHTRSNHSNIRVSNREMEYEQLEDLNIYWMRSTDITSEEEYSTEKHYFSKIVQYSDFSYLKTTFYNCLLFKTEYGYRIESYGADNTRDESELSSYIGEIGYLGHGRDDTILDLFNRQRLTYKYTNLYDNNSIIEFLIQLKE